MILGLFGWVRYEIRSQGQAINKRIDDLRTDNNKRIDDLRADVVGLRAEMNQRFDQVHRELGENRERMASSKARWTGSSLGEGTGTPPDTDYLFALYERMTTCLRTRRIAAERHAPQTGRPGPEEQRPGARSYSLEGPANRAPLERDAAEPR